MEESNSVKFNPSKILNHNLSHKSLPNPFLICMQNVIDHPYTNSSSPIGGSSIKVFGGLTINLSSVFSCQNTAFSRAEKKEVTGEK